MFLFGSVSYDILSLGFTSVAFVDDLNAYKNVPASLSDEFCLDLSADEADVICHWGSYSERQF